MVLRRSGIARGSTSFITPDTEMQEAEKKRGALLVSRLPSPRDGLEVQKQSYYMVIACTKGKRKRADRIISPFGVYFAVERTARVLMPSHHSWMP